MMYTIESTENGLRIFGADRLIAEGICPSLTFDDGTTVFPALKDTQEMFDRDRLGASIRYAFTYSDADETFALTLTFTCYADVLVASAALLAKKEGVGVRQKSLAAFGGLRLTVDSLGDVNGLMANYLHKDWWTRPHFDANLAALPPRTQSLLWRSGETYHHLLPVCGDVFKTELCGSGLEGGFSILTAAYTGGYSRFETVTFVLASGDNPFDLPERNVAAGMQALGKPFQTREHKRYPEPFEYLGWCSWDAFYHQVNAEGVLAKAAELQEKGLPFRWFIVDDGWMTSRETRLTTFAPDLEKFPAGFAPLIDRLKDEYGLEWVGVWHTLFGYWQGVDPDGPLAKTLAHALHMTLSGRLAPGPEAAKAFAFWDAWHAELRGAGVDFVKVDCQSGLPAFWNHQRAIGDVARNAHGALEASVGKHFDGTVINCMGMATENIWHRTSAVTRNSDDFFPKDPDSFIEHALQNAYNAYYHAPLMWLDWDMWWTRHDNAAVHAMMRAVSGGPVYVSDRVGETDATQIWPLVLSDGRLLRCDLPGMATEDCLLRDPSKAAIPLKLWNRVGDVGVVAAFNVNLERQAVSGVVGPTDVPGLTGERFVVYEHFSRKAQVVNYDARLPVTLDANQCALYLFAPVVGPCTPLGLVDKYIAPAAIADWRSVAERTLVLLLDGGIFAWAAERKATRVLVNGERVTPGQGDGFFFVDCRDIEGLVWIEIAGISPVS